MDVPALTAASGASGGVDGKIESVQDGKALVRLSGGAQVQVSVDREIPQGTPVTVAAASDGTLQLTVRIPDAELAKLRDAIWKTLQSLVGDSLATELAVPLAKGATSVTQWPCRGRGTCCAPRRLGFAHVPRASPPRPCRCGHGCRGGGTGVQPQSAAPTSWIAVQRCRRWG